MGSSVGASVGLSVGEAVELSAAGVSSVPCVRSVPSPFPQPHNRQETKRDSANRLCAFLMIAPFSGEYAPGKNCFVDTRFFLWNRTFCGKYGFVLQKRPHSLLYRKYNINIRKNLC